MYDLRADPAELTDLAATQPQQVTELAGTWDEWAKRCNVLPYPAAK